MKVYRSLADINIDFETSVALGNFDGVHIGHQKILKSAVQMAESLGVMTACFTFSNHPRELFSRKDDSGILFIANDDEKLQLFEDAGIEVVFDIPFDEVMMNMLPEVFIKDILCDKLKAKGVSCGFNYRFGTRASGDDQLLLKLGNRYGYETSIIQPVKVGSEIVSSTAIRTYIESGDIVKANEFLGRPFRIFGAVVRGNHIGSKIGFPTANIELSSNKVAPMNGVYFTRTSVDGSTYNSVSNIGTKPTIGDYEKSIETHIFGINEELYGREIKVEFLKLHRPEVKFETVELLTERIADDVESARRFHGVK